MTNIALKCILPALSWTLKPHLLVACLAIHISQVSDGMSAIITIEYRFETLNSPVPARKSVWEFGALRPAIDTPLHSEIS